MLSKTAEHAINNLVYQALYLAHLGCPPLDHQYAMGFPYEDLTQFIYDLDEANDEEKEYVKSVIKEELENGSYLGIEDYSKAHVFIKNLLTFFDDNGKVDLNSFWFGKAVLNEIVVIVGNHILEKYDNVFKELAEYD